MFVQGLRRLGWWMEWSQAPFLTHPKVIVHIPITEGPEEARNQIVRPLAALTL